MKIPEAQRLLRAEAQRAISLFPNDESEAICEIIRRSDSIPELKRTLVIYGSFVVIAEERGTGQFMVPVAS